MAKKYLTDAADPARAVDRARQFRQQRIASGCMDRLRNVTESITLRIQSIQKRHYGDCSAPWIAAGNFSLMGFGA